MFEEKHFTRIITSISDRFSNTNDKEIFRAVILDNFIRKMDYVKDPEWTVCGAYIESLEEKITDDIIDELDRISFLNHLLVFLVELKILDVYCIG